MSTAVERTPSADVTSTVTGEVIEPKQRAEQRLAQLQTTFAETLRILSDMFRDEDWRYLTKPDGTDYANFTELVAVTLDKSSSYARRYIQGIGTLYQPLQGIVVDDTRIEITSRDVAILGIDGARQVIESVGAAVLDPATPSDPDAHSAIVSDAIDTAKKDRTPSQPSSTDDNDWMDDDDPNFGEFDGGPAELGQNTGGQRSGGKNSDAGGSGDSGGGPGNSGPKFPTPDNEQFPGAPRTGIKDPLDEALKGCDEYSSAQEIEQLPDHQLKELRSALNTLLSLDPRAVAAAIDEEHRGVLVDSQDAALRITTIRSIVKANAEWIER